MPLICGALMKTAMQNGVDLDIASIVTDYDAFTTVIDDQFKEIAPGQPWR